MGPEAPPPACSTPSSKSSPLVLGKPGCLDRKGLAPLQPVTGATAPVQVPAVRELAASHLFELLPPGEDRIAPGLPKELEMPALAQ